MLVGLSCIQSSIRISPRLHCNRGLYDGLYDTKRVVHITVPCLGAQPGWSGRVVHKPIHDIVMWFAIYTEPALTAKVSWGK